MTPATSAENPSRGQAGNAPAGPRLHAIAGFALVTIDLPRLAGFYCEVLGFAAHGSVSPIDPDELRLLGLSGSGRRQKLCLGEQIAWIEQFEPAGCVYPTDGDAASLWFQHFAIVVGDMQAAHARLRDITPISRDGPQKLPSGAGGVTAFKFRDPDGHPLELLQFAPGNVPDAWRDCPRLQGQIGLGIDHSAISVAATGVSALFYQALGLNAGQATLNQGPAQQRLDGLCAVEVEVLPVFPNTLEPHLELLGYRTSGGKAGPKRGASDVAATRIVWRGREPGLITDPDGHLHQVRAP